MSSTKPVTEKQKGQQSQQGNDRKQGSNSGESQKNERDSGNQKQKGDSEINLRAERSPCFASSLHKAALAST